MKTPKSTLTAEGVLAPVNGSALRGPSNPVLRDPDDFGSREFWKAANAHAVRRWAAEADKVVQMQALLDWAETLLCNARPEPHAASEWHPIVQQWREQKNAAGRLGSGLEAQTAKGCVSWME